MSLEQYQQQCQEKLTWAVEKLQIEVDSQQLQEIAALIVQTMTGPWRYFHTPTHIFAVGGSEDPIEVLAALFHDIVYVQIDHSVHFNLAYYLAPFIKQIQAKLVIRESHQLPADEVVELVMIIFGLAPGQVLSPFGGQNEFLSALVAAKALEKLLPLPIIAQVVAGIEGTIPFRAPTEQGLTSSEQLYHKLIAANQKFQLQLKDEEILQTIHKSVRIANRDVSGFGNSSACFLDNTWNLLPETNHHLRARNAYTIQEYRIALDKMAGFLNFLQPEVVFRQFRGQPDDLTYQKIITQTSHNLEVGRLYLSSKIAAIALLEALSLRFGEDISLATMMGQLPDARVLIPRLSNFLPEVENPYQLETNVEKEVLNLLEKGRTQTSDYDLNNSPLATYIVKVIGFEGVRCQLEAAQDFFTGKISREDFLNSCESELTQAVTAGVSKMFDCRKAALCMDD